jgi:hypothetical protein
MEKWVRAVVGVRMGVVRSEDGREMKRVGGVGMDQCEGYGWSVGAVGTDHKDDTRKREG